MEEQGSMVRHAAWRDRRMKFPGSRLLTRLTIMLMVLSLGLPAAYPAAYGSEAGPVKIVERETLIVDGGSSVTGAVYYPTEADVIAYLKANVTSATLIAEDDTRVQVDVDSETWEAARRVPEEYDLTLPGYYDFWAEIKDPPDGYVNPWGIEAYVKVAVKGQDVSLLDPLPAAAPGLKQGTTRVTGLPTLGPWSGEQYVVRVTSSSTPIPNEIDGAFPGYEGFVAYRGGEDIPGVDAVNNKYIAVYKVGGMGKIISFGEIELVAEDIADSDWQIPEFVSLQAERGTKPGTTKLTGVTKAANHTLRVQISSKPIDRPAVGVPFEDNSGSYPPPDRVMTGSEHVIQDYTIGADVGGVDVTSNKYIALYETDNDSNYVARFSQLELTSGNFSQRDFTDVWYNLMPLAPKPTTKSLMDVTYGQGIYVAVGEAGTILTSHDGLDWEEQDSGENFENFNSIGYFNGKFMATNSSCSVFVSSNGTVWDKIAIDDNSFTCYISKVVYGDRDGHGSGTLVAVSAAGGGMINKHIYISKDDGLTWMMPDQPDIQMAPISDIVFADGKFIAATQGYQIYENGQFKTAPGGIIVSEDEGESWQKINEVYANKLVYVDSVLYASIPNAAGQFPTVSVSNDDGLTWQSRSMMSPQILNAFAHDGKGNYVWVGGDEMILASSDGGATWDNRYKSSGLASTGFAPVQYFGAAYGDDGRVVIVGARGDILTPIIPPPAPDFDPLPDAEPGVATGTTKLPSVTLGKVGNKLKLRVTSAPIAPESRPYVWDDVPAGAVAYTIGDDISGVDATTNKYVELYETSPSGKILSFSIIELTSADIKSGSSGGNPAPGFGSTPTAEPGTQPGTTKVTGVTAGGNNQLKVLVTSNSTSKPNVGDAVPNGAKAYTVGSDITGVDATTNKYIAVYEVDGNGKIVKFSEIVLSSGNINSGSSGGVILPAPTLAADDSDNDTAHPIELTFIEDSAWRGAITEVKVDGTTLSASNYTITAGRLSIHAGKLSSGTHTITVKATGYADTSVTQSVNLPGKPSNPQSLIAVAGDGSVNLTWSAVSGVTDYRVYVSETPHTFADGNYTTVTGTTAYQVQGLTNGKKYYFVVKSVSGSDLSAASNEAEAVPATVPGTPTGVTATAGNGQATISFTPPASTGGSAITEYKVISQPDGITATGTTSPITMTGLTNGTPYTFTVVAVNIAGESAPAASTASVTPTGPAGAPSAPTNVTAVAGSGEATISFTLPANDGGSAITEYKVISQPGGIEATGTNSPIKVTGLTNGTAYTFSVVAKNGAGDSPASASSGSVTPTAAVGVPSAPTGVTAAAENGQATVSFTPPVSTGGSPITGYKVISQPGGFTATGTASPITITGLTNDTSYTFKVVATNSAGDSPASAASTSVTPMAPAGAPGVPTGVSAVAGNGEATISFTPPTGGNPITGYKVTSHPDGLTATGADSPITITGLTNGKSYTFTVVAQNNGVDSAASVASASVTPKVPATAPGAPTGVTAVAGNGQATVSFTPPANDGGSMIMGYKVITEPGGMTVTGTKSPITVTGLTNGTSYTFKVIATNSVNDSPESAPSASVTPTAPAGSPGEPTNVTAVAGNGEATISFTPPTDNGGNPITGYKVTSQPDGITATGTTSPITIIGLTNGTAYTFTVVATNSKGDSAASAASTSVTPTAPAGSPGAPTNVIAVAGNGQATISFTPPADNGGNPVTEYKVTSQPGGITVTGTKSPITITGLTNGTSYTFTVQAINSAGSSAASAASSAVVPRTSGGTGGDTGSNSGNNGANGGATSPSGNANEEAVIVLVNGKEENAGKATTGKRNEQTLLTIVVDQKKLDDKLAAEGQGAVVTIPVKTKSDVIIGELNGQMVKNMENKEAVLVLQTDHATYTIPAHEINIDAIFAQLGKPSNLTDIQVRIEISASQAETIKLAENAAAKGTFSLVMPPLEFNITAVYGNQTVNVTKFNAYVERTVAIPDGIDPNKITTGVVIETDGSVRHVPTQVTKNGARYFAKINSLTNSTYAVVWNPIEFSDVAKHWAKSAVNDMGSRMVIDGTGGGKFTPNRDITRAEFAAILVRGLGLKPESGATSFSDVKAADWYSGVINTAYAYGLIDGFEDGTFRPKDKITREQAMLILSKAMVLTGLTDTLSVPSAEAVLSPYGDASKVAKWAQNGVAGSVEAGIVTGRSADTLAPKANMTRAEVAAIIQRLLQKSELIEVK